MASRWLFCWTRKPVVDPGSCASRPPTRRPPADLLLRVVLVHDRRVGRDQALCSRPARPTPRSAHGPWPRAASPWAGPTSHFGDPIGGGKNVVSPAAPSSPATEMSSSRSGQWMPIPGPIRRQLISLLGIGIAKARKPPYRHRQGTAVLKVDHEGIRHEPSTLRASSLRWTSRPKYSFQRSTKAARCVKVSSRNCA